MGLLRLAGMDIVEHVEYSIFLFFLLYKILCNNLHANYLFNKLKLKN